MQTVESISALKGLAVPPTNTIVYVENYHATIPGGGGIFVYSQSSIPDNGGIYIKPYTNPTVGRWIRQYEGYIDIRYFGVLGLWGNYTQQFQDAINYANENATSSNSQVKNATIFIPNGSYVIDQITLKDGVSIIGESLIYTVIYPSIKPTDTIDDYLVVMEKGRLRTNISNIGFVGSYKVENVDKVSPKSVIKLHAQKPIPTDPLSDGGISYSTFKNINISYFNGNGIHLKGGIEDYNCPNQFTVFENVRFTKGSLEIACYGLIIEGQHGQLTFTNCEFNGGNAGTNDISHSPNVYLKAYDLTTNPVFNNAAGPAVITFLNCTFQNSVLGMHIDGGQNITVDNCWFERLHVGVFVDGRVLPSKGISIVNNLFGNASGYGSIIPPGNLTKQNGACIQTIKSFVSVINNNVITSTNSNDDNNPDFYLDPTCQFVYSFPDNLGVKIFGNTFSSKYVSKTYGIVKTILMQATDYSILKCDQHNVIEVHGNGNVIRNIDSTINTTEQLTIIAMNSLTFGKPASSGDNISFPGTNNTFVLSTGERATFVKRDIGGNFNDTFELIAILKANP